MLKKTIVIVLLVGLVGILLIGAVNRTLARTESESGSQGRGGQGSSTNGGDLINFGVDKTDQNLEIDGNGWGRGRQDLDSEDGSLSTGRDAYAEVGKNGGYGQGRDGSSETHEFIPENQGELSEAEKEALIFMREEEKLARDVYLAMYELWGMPIFKNISRSEQSHTEAVKTLLDG